MLQNKYFALLVNFVVSCVIVCTVFPLIPGIDFSGNVPNGILLALGNTLLGWAMVIVSLIVVVVVGIVYCIRNDISLSMRNSTMTRWCLKQGYWKMIVGGNVVSLAFCAFTWKLTALFSSSLTIHGILPAIIGAAVSMAITTSYKLVTDPMSMSPTAFREKLEASLAKELEEEEKKK